MGNFIARRRRELMYFGGFALTFSFFRILIWQQGGKKVYLEIAGIFVSMMFIVLLVCCRSSRRRPAAGERGLRMRINDHLLLNMMLGVGDEIYNRYYAPPREGLTREEIAALPKFSFNDGGMILCPVASTSAVLVSAETSAMDEVTGTMIKDESELMEIDMERGLNSYSQLPEKNLITICSFQNMCSVCLVDYQQNDSLIVLPCHHDYHEACITEWLLQKAWCPLCKRGTHFGPGRIGPSSEASTTTIISLSDFPLETTSDNYTDNPNVGVSAPTPDLFSIPVVEL